MIGWQRAGRVPDDFGAFEAYASDVWKLNKALEEWRPRPLAGVQAEYRKALGEADDRRRKTVKQAKAGLFPAVAWGWSGEGVMGQAPKRDRTSACGLNPLFCADIDSVTDAPSARDAAAAAPHVLAAGVSVGGGGVWVVVLGDCSPADEAEYKAAWWLAARHLVAHGVGVEDGNGKADRAPSSCISLRFAAHDPDLRYNPSADPLALPGDLAAVDLADLRAQCGFGPSPVKGGAAAEKAPTTKGGTKASTKGGAMARSRQPGARGAVTADGLADVPEGERNDTWGAFVVGRAAAGALSLHHREIWGEKSDLDQAEITRHRDVLIDRGLASGLAEEECDEARFDRCVAAGVDTLEERLYAEGDKHPLRVNASAPRLDPASAGGGGNYHSTATGGDGGSEAAPADIDWQPLAGAPLDLPEGIIGRASGVALAAGDVLMLSGAGGGGKSTLALQVAMTMALAEDGEDSYLFQHPRNGTFEFKDAYTVRGGPVVVVGYEDILPWVRDRANRIGRWLHADARALDQWEPPGADRISTAVLEQPLFMAPAGGDPRFALPEPTGTWRALWDRVRKVKARLVVVDPAALSLEVDHYGAAPVNRFVGALRREASAAGAGVLLVAHSAKAARSKKADDDDPGVVAGSAAWWDRVRGVWVLKRAGDSRPDGGRLLRLAMVKANYAPVDSDGGGYILSPQTDAAIDITTPLGAPAAFRIVDGAVDGYRPDAKGAKATDAKATTGDTNGEGDDGMPDGSDAP